MAVSVSQDADRFVVEQTRRGLRRWLWIVAALMLLGFATTALGARRVVHESLRCERATQTCVFAIEPDHYRHAFALDALAGAEWSARRVTHGLLGADDFVSVRVARGGDLPDLTLCSATADDPLAQAARRSAEAIERFRADGSQAVLAVACDARPDAGRSGLLVRLLAGGGGMLLVLFMMGSWMVETRAEFDRAAGVVRLRGRTLFGANWSVERPLRDVRSIRTRRSVGGYGERYLRAYAVFADGSTWLLCAPATGRRGRFDAQVAALRAFLGHESEGGA
jgi:hypothetical protein